MTPQYFLRNNYKKAFLITILTDSSKYLMSILSNI